MDRVHNIQRNAVGEVGPGQCVLCGDHASLLAWGSSAHVTCKDCEQVAILLILVLKLVLNKLKTIEPPSTKLATKLTIIKID